ncbi:MAG: metal ABC transporter permease [Methanomicrobiales archaeon]|nr:metal ABC transporter permease [Methanomicrobiales archaeon]
MIEALGYEFFRSALAAGILSSIVCGIIGSYVVVKHMISVAGGISHAAFGGIGLGYFLGVDPIAGAFWFTLGVATLIWGLIDRARQHIDTLIGAFWAGGMAFGILCLSLTPGYTPDLFSYLFGNILLVPSGHLTLIAFLCAVVVGLVALLYPALQAIAFDQEYASISGLPTRIFNLLVLLLIAVSVVVLIQIVGIILVIALLTLPAAIIRPFSNTLKGMMIGATLTGMFITTTGIYLSWIFDVPSGSTIILLGVTLYFLVLCYKEVIFRVKTPKVHSE